MRALLPLSMAMHIGKSIKEELYKQGISVSVFAKKINKSRNVVYDIFGRESIDTGLLHKIGKILGCDFFSLYSSQKEYTSQSVKHLSIAEPASIYGKQAEEILLLQQQNEALHKEIAYLKKIITLLEMPLKAKTGKGKL